MKVMEISMYGDGAFNNGNNTQRENAAQMKRKFTLDLTNRPTKKIRIGGTFNSLLTSPDLNMLKLGSPELDQLVLQQGGTLLPSGFNFNTPNGTTSITPISGYKSQIPTTVSQEELVKEFQETLEQFHRDKGSNNVIVTSQSFSSPSKLISVEEIPRFEAIYSQINKQDSKKELEYTVLECQPHPQRNITPASSISSEEAVLSIKEEPQIVPSSSPPISPIDMADQERIKLERKRLRNRIAATKCRKRKLERISKLEDKVSQLKSENFELQSVITSIKDEVCHLKQQVMEHVNAGCQIPFILQ